jgi:hypothetical protein
MIPKQDWWISIWWLVAFCLVFVDSVLVVVPMVVVVMVEELVYLLDGVGELVLSWVVYLLHCLWDVLLVELVLALERMLVFGEDAFWI